MFFIIVTLKSLIFFLFFFNDTATTEIYTLSLHDALPIYLDVAYVARLARINLSEEEANAFQKQLGDVLKDRKSTRLNSSHSQISYAVFCLKKKKNRILVKIY